MRDCKETRQKSKPHSRQLRRSIGRIERDEHCAEARDRKDRRYGLRGIGQQQDTVLARAHGGRCEGSAQRIRISLYGGKGAPRPSRRRSL